MSPASEAAIRSGDYVLVAEQLGESLNPLRYEFRVFHNVRRMRDYAGNQDFSFRQLDRFPQGVFVLVPRVGCFDQVSLRLHGEQNIHQVLQFQIVSVRTVPASPTEVIADPILGDVAQCIVQRLNAHLAPAFESLKADADSDAVPEGGQPRVVDLQDNARLDDGVVLLAQRLSQSEDEVFIL
jgi:hypothetical protein